MGDHRASITIKMHAHGKDYEQEWWINWSPNDDGCDQRIVDWFRECWDDAYSRYYDEMQEAQAEMAKQETEAAERAELARLKAKYEP